MLLATSASRCAVKQWINNTCQLKWQSGVFVWAIVGTKSPYLCLLKACDMFSNDWWMESILHSDKVFIIPYILEYKSNIWVVKREFPEAPQLVRASYFLPAERKMFSAILDTQHYRIQPSESQSQNKFVTSLPTNPLLFNK